MKGVYVLLLKLEKDKAVQVGRLGLLVFSKGYYAYAGSARGTGGFKRVTRHFNVASGKNKTRKWHIDYLLPHTEVVCAVLLPAGVPECTVAKSIGESFGGVPGFGCTDCTCMTHLFFSETDMKGTVAKMCSELAGIESIIMRPDV